MVPPVPRMATTSSIRASLASGAADCRAIQSCSEGACGKAPSIIPRPSGRAGPGQAGQLGGELAVDEQELAAAARQDVGVFSAALRVDGQPHVAGADDA